MDRANELYRNTPRCLLVLFDVKCREVEQRLYREIAGWGSFARIERLTSDRVVLVVQPGGAMR